jgi:hypothetical protein
LEGPSFDSGNARGAPLLGRLLSARDVRTIADDFYERSADQLCGWLLSRVYQRWRDVG